MWRLVGVVVVGLLLGCRSKGSNGVTPPPAQTEILWDTWGVPHIYGRTTAELFRAVGWAQMEAHGDLLLRMYGQARGRAAEYWGEADVASDQRVHTMGIPALAKAWLAAQPPESRTILESYAAGINAWAAAHADRVPGAL